MVRFSILTTLAGCQLGYPLPDPATPEPLWDDTFDCIEEWEPNDFDSIDDLHSLGVPPTSGPMEVCGTLTATGAAEGTLTGDLDFYVFELLEPRWIELDLPGSTVDATLYLATTEEFADRSWSGTLEPGLHVFRVAAGSGPTGPYRLVVESR